MSRLFGAPARRRWGGRSAGPPQATAGPSDRMPGDSPGCRASNAAQPAGDHGAGRWSATGPAMSLPAEPIARMGAATLVGARGAA